MSNGNAPAFPGEQGHSESQGWNQTWECGLSKREIFAAMAMQGTLARSPGGLQSAERIARASVIMADALLEELAKPQGAKPLEPEEG